MSGPLRSALCRRRFLTLVLFDALMWAVASALAVLVRLDFKPIGVAWSKIAIVVIAAFLVYLFLGWITRLHEGRAQLASVEETVLIGLVAVASGVTVFAINLVFPQVARSIPVLTSAIAALLMVLGRALYRALELSESVKAAAVRDNRVVVVGAGDAGRQVIASMLRSDNSAWLPVAIVDDDREKRYLRINGIPVRGQIADIVKVADAAAARTVIVAIPSADRDLFQRVSHHATRAGLAIKVLPSVDQLFSGRAEIRDLRDIDVNDLLGRQAVDTDLASIAEYLTGRRVLVTGAGGSIGSELCRQISRFSPAALLMLDRDESALHAVQLSIYGHGMLDSSDVLLCDIRDGDALNKILVQREPEVVFHAAALKHLPLLEQYPDEGLKSNVFGTLNVLRAAELADVERFVNISTDKAADPVNVLGYTKRIAEGLTSHVSRRTAGTYLSVRFGNVLGSRGSVLETFARQIASGGPVTVTHPDVTRYFMTIPEAVQLVIQAAALGEDGEALVLDMGDPIRIDYVAKQLIAQSGKAIEVKYTGLRTGEKMHEDLVAGAERERRDKHPSISCVDVPAIDPTTVLDLRELDPQSLKLQLSVMCERLAQRGADGASEAPVAK